MTKQTFLICYDYGTGGVWFLIDANSKEQVEKLHPQFEAFTDKPDWMSEEDKIEYYETAEKVGSHWDIDDEPQGWLKLCLND